jgi:hypothetical protein
MTRLLCHADRVFVSREAQQKPICKGSFRMAEFTKQMTVAQFEALFPTSHACKAYLVARRWPNGVRCPRCGNEDVHPVSDQPFRWQCAKCAMAGDYRFSVLVGTIFENTNVGLRTWFRVIHMMLTFKKGVSSLQVYRVIGLGSYRAAVHMTDRIRAGLQDPDFCKLVGIVGVDETSIGGSDKNPPADRGDPSKTRVVRAIRRKGNAIASVREHATKDP